MTTRAFDLTEAGALDLDAQDELGSFRDRHCIPRAQDGHPCVYMTGNSLGCQPVGAAELVSRELEDWARLGVRGHVEGRDPWVRYHEQFRPALSRLIGAKPSEVVMMNTLTVNLHLMMVGFYRPTPRRYKIVIEDDAFPSDSYAVASHLRLHGIDVARGLVRLMPREGEHVLRTEDIERAIEAEGDQIALVMLGGVNYLTGQLFDIGRITTAGRRAGAVVGWDLAHAIGNVPLAMHDCGADFAAWCSYKYLNGGPGAVAGAFVHERHHDGAVPRLEGWWGTEPSTRFKMGREFQPGAGADAWQLSNPPILSMTPLKAALEAFDEATISRLREKSVALTGYLEAMLVQRCGRIEILTPREPECRGAQLSLRVPGMGRSLLDRLESLGAVVDYREPDVIRVAPAPMYVSFHDVWRFVDLLDAALQASE